MPINSSRRHLAKKHMDKKLIFRIRIFVVVFLVMLGIMGYDIYQGTLTFALALLALIIGTGLGILSDRMFSLKWHEDSNKIISQVDKVGVVIIGLYILISVFKGQILGHFFHGPTLTAFSFSIIGGVMLGRVLGAGFNIQKILKAQGILK